MPSLRRPSPSALCAALAALLVSAGVAWLLSRSTSARAASVGQLQQRISAGQGRISGLSAAVGAASSRMRQLSSGIAGLQQRIGRIQAALNSDRAQLLLLRGQLDAARARLAQLEAYEAHAESVLAEQMVGMYESQPPDIVSVVLESTGFQDLLNRLSFAQRVQKQDARVVAAVRSARRAVAAQATRLGALELHQQNLTQQILLQRNGLAQARVSLLRERITVARSRERKTSQLISFRREVAGLQGQLASVEAAQAAAAAQQTAQQAAQQAARNIGSGPVPASQGAGGTSGPIQISSGGGFVFPMPKGAASPPGTWSLDQGVDISAPGGTPEVAVCSGTIVLHGIGGFGPWAPVLHCDSALAGYNYVYYGHAGPANQLPVGSHVGAGQVMSEVGPGIVGISSGPHLEIGFCDGSGTPLGGGTASTMMSLLQGAYG